MRSDTDTPTACIIAVVAASEIHMNGTPVACIMPRKIRAVTAVLGQASGGIAYDAGKSRAASDPSDWRAAHRAGAALFHHVVVMGLGPWLSSGHP